MTTGEREPIAVVGVACRFPGHANDPESFYELCMSDTDAITRVPASRWDADALHDPDPDARGKSVSSWGGFVDRTEYFDADLFGMTGHEARMLDPQQRLLLEVTWEALESAGRSPRGMSGSRTGVFVGLSAADYFFERLRHLDRLDASSALGGIHVAPGRISQHFGLRGPSMLIDAACSSGLVAVHTAAESLRAGDCDVALVGACNVIASPAAHVVFSRARLLAADGRCRTFDARADGYVRSEGCAVLVLKSLRSAAADGDRIHAVIRGSAVNHSGRGAGLSVPDVDAQADVARVALQRSGFVSTDVGYVEAHGTATPLGDAMELRALSRVLAVGRTAASPLVVSAVKPHIGHSEAASGLASMVKAILSLQHGTVPAIRALETVHPDIELSPHVVLARESTLLRGRVACVHSFSVVGTNAHVVLERAPETARVPIPRGDRPTHLLTLSAFTGAALCELAHRYEQRLGRVGATEAVADICFTAGAGRAPLPHRIAVTGATTSELREGLASFTWGRRRAGLVKTRPKIALAFAAGDAALGPLLDAIAAGDPGFREQVASSKDAETKRFLHALSDAWRRWGVKPHAVLGTGAGESVAAEIADRTPNVRLVPTTTGMRAALAATAALGCDVLLEIGPQATLASDVLQLAPTLAYVASLRSGKEPWSQLLATLGSLYERGVEIDWNGLDMGRSRARIELPTYPFERARHFIDATLEDAPAAKRVEREARPRSPGSANDRAPSRGALPSEGLRARVASAPAAERSDVVVAYLRAHLARLLERPHDRIDGGALLRELGLDSLRAVDLLALLARELGRTFPAYVVIEHPSLDALASYLLDELTRADP